MSIKIYISDGLKSENQKIFNDISVNMRDVGDTLSRKIKDMNSPIEYTSYFVREDDKIKHVFGGSSLLRVEDDLYTIDNIMKYVAGWLSSLNNFSEFKWVHPPPPINDIIYGAVIPHRVFIWEIVTIIGDLIEYSGDVADLYRESQELSEYTIDIMRRRV